jgi:3-oxoacyl-[acyl-carrier-protein] synthase-3
MDGNAVFIFSTSDVCDSIKDFKMHFSLYEETIDYYVLHQAQKLIVDGITNECELPQDKVLTSYNEYGNTNTSSIPVTMCLHHELFNCKNHVNVHMCGFGVGLAWSNIFTTIEPGTVFPIIESNKTYNDL